MGDVLTWRVGDVAITRVEDVLSPIPFDYLLTELTEAQLETNADWLAPYFIDGLMQLSFHTFVVQTGDTTIVVDTCLGDDPERRVPGDPEFPNRLGAAIAGGLEAVDIVLCTHLHFDHVGWNTRVIDGVRVPTFPNARYLFSQAEMDFLDLDDHHEIRDADVQPLLDAGLVDLIDTSHAFTPEVRTVPTLGHTPGHVSLLIESAGQSALITGDAAHSPVQFRYPELAATHFDWDSSMSTATRRQLVADYTDTGTLILGTHFAPPTAGHLQSDGDHIRFQ